jgi:hypothetical protein
LPYFNPFWRVGCYRLTCPTWGQNQAQTSLFLGVANESNPAVAARAGFDSQVFEKQPGREDGTDRDRAMMLLIA